LPWQKGQNPPFFLCTGGDAKSVGRFPLSVAMTTHLPEIGSLLSSGIIPPYQGYRRQNTMEKLGKRVPTSHSSLSIPIDFFYYITVKYSDEAHVSP
jgi:hypothetical protein